MCMMIYSPTGKALSGNFIRHIDARNNDGIGIMANGMASRFYGPRQVRDALAMMRALSAAGMAYGLHFRWATTGTVGPKNVHPFDIPGSDMYMMHNGVLGIPADESGRSDTSQFATNELCYSPGIEATDYWRDVGDIIGYPNKLLLMDYAGQFRIVNESQGDWIDGVWYSQTYSLPYSMRPYVPSKIVTGRIPAAIPRLVDDPEFSWGNYK